MNECSELFTRVLKKNDIRALKKLFELVNNKIYNMAYRILRDSGLAEDVVQEAWIKVWEKRNEFNPKYNFCAWIYKIAYRIALHKYRDRKPTEDITNYTYIKYEGDDDEQKEILHRAINLLDIECRNLIYMKYFDDLTYKEIAEILDMEFNHVRYQLYVCRHQLLIILQQLGYENE